LSKREWVLIVISLGLVVAQIGLELQLPQYMQEITVLTMQTTVMSDADEIAGIMGQIWWAGGKMLICTLISALSTIVNGFCAARLGAGVSHTLRGKIFSRVEAFTMEEIGHFSTASLITRTTNDIQQIQMIIAMGMQMIIRAPIMAVMAFSKISTKQSEWTILTGIALAGMLTLISFVIVYAIPKFRKIQMLTDNLNRVTRENLNGIRVVRAYNAEEYQEGKFERANDDLTTNNLKVNRAMAIFQPGINLIMNCMSIGIFWIGAYIISRAEQNAKFEIFGDMTVFSNYAMMLLMSFMSLVMIFMMAPRVTVSARRINEVLDTEPKILDGKLTASPAGVEGEIEFRNVGFKYPDAEDYVLKNVNFTCHKGDTVAFIGSTGSGKSTLINLVPRFYDVSEGAVLIDGIDVREYTQEALRKKIGYVPQKATLFTGNVSTNVSYGDASGELGDANEITRALRVAQATEFVEKMDGGVVAAISQGGQNISGGQKQRLSIARAIYRRPEIYIFDDSFSALDYKTDQQLRAALRTESAGVTNLIVAQRIGTIRDADKIIVLEAGQLVGEGTHDELMASCEVYREIAFSQLSKEELGA
jgi:ATP-binding cassette subfamily B protein